MVFVGTMTSSCSSIRNSCRWMTSQVTRPAVCSGSCSSSSIAMLLLQLFAVPPYCQPWMSNCLHWGHPRLRIQVQTALEKVHKCTILTVPQGIGRQILGPRRSPVLPPPRPSPGELDRTVRAEAHLAVPRMTLRTDKVPSTLGGL